MSSPPPTSPPPVLANPLASPPEIGLRPTLPDPSCTHCSGYLPSLPHAASIAFRHPGYDDQSNLLFRLQAFDSPDSLTWGLHHHTALTACSIIACNIEGFLSPTRLGSSTPPILPSLDSLLTSRVYYFYPSTVSGGIELASVDLRYPICPDFIHWQFPHNDFPKEWLEIDPELLHTSVPAVPAASQYSLAVQRRDECCRISGYRDGSQTAHLIPEAQSQWFVLNGMSIYNLNDDLPPKFITCDVENCLLLRQDLHTAFDSKHFVFVPKQRSWRIHFLAVTADYGRLLHNRQPHALKISPQFLYARFAWAILGRVKTFASLPGVKIRVRVESGKWEDTVVPSTTTMSVALAPPAKRRRKNDAPKTGAEAAQDSHDDVSSPPAPDAPCKRAKRIPAAAKHLIFNALVTQSPQYAWNALRWHPDSDRLNRMKDKYLMEHEPILHQREVGRQLAVLEGGDALWDDESQSVDVDEDLEIGAG